MLYHFIEAHPDLGSGMLTIILMVLVIALFWLIQARWEREDEIEFWRKYRWDEAHRLYKTRCVYPPELDGDFIDPTEIDPKYHNRGDL